MHCTVLHVYVKNELMVVESCALHIFYNVAQWSLIKCFVCDGDVLLCCTRRTYFCIQTNHYGVKVGSVRCQSSVKYQGRVLYVTVLCCIFRYYYNCAL
jgi:hypothetical protein